MTNEKYTLECQLAFRSIGYRSVQADPDISFDSESSTVPQNLGIFIIFSIKLFLNFNVYYYFCFVGVYSVGWLSSGPVGVILSTMTNAFQVASLIGKDIDSGVLNEKKPGYDYVSKILKNKGIYYNVISQVNKIYQVIFVYRYNYC